MRKTILATTLIATLLGTPARAAIAYTGLNIAETYLQTSTGISHLESFIGFALNTQAPNDFTSAVVQRPDGSSLALNYSPFLVGDGTYRAGSRPEVYGDTAALNAANPFGQYTFTATNSAMGASQSSSLLYDSNHWPSNVPALTSGSFASLNTVDPNNPFTFQFNNFTGDGFNPFPNGARNPSMSVLIRTSNGTNIYNSGALDPSTTSFTLPGGMLDSGADYLVALAFANIRHAPVGSAEGYFLGFQRATYAAFTTIAGPSPPVTLSNIEGGTPTNPVPLPVVGRIGQLTG